ncbi:B-cell receptor CD22-like [Alosa sapidissima]|uniref:B-cell receptor CD22-like n=1 Tax=Alosa sapidissima TaxID=34773 RepID=UPI001C099AD4|nr:B-cell receptor CD22-like [Alosa sapidissima]
MVSVKDKTVIRSLLCGPNLTYSSTQVCGLKGASVLLPCRYEYPWKGRGDTYLGGEWYEEKSGRVIKHSHSNYPDCSLNIDKLSDGDSGVYHFRFYTVLHTGWITARSGVTLSVTDLQVKENAVVANQNQTKVTCSTSCSLGSQYVWYKNGQPLQGETTVSILLQSTRPSEAAYYSCAVTMTSETVTEGGEVTLTCSTCTQSNNPTLIWYKNNQPVSNQHTTRDNKLHLNPVSSEDAGSYSCAVKGDESLSSTAVFLNVRYVPKNVSVSIKASSKIEEDSVVTLTCSSDANPPVHTYTWYMKSGAESLARGTGESISFNLTSDTSGPYHCEAQNEVGSTNSSQTPVQIVTEDDHVAAMMFQAGIILFVILTITLVFATLWLRKKKKMHLSSSPYPLEADASDVYDNVMPTTMTSDPGQRVDSQGDEDDVHYASIQFQPRTKKQKPLYSNRKSVQQLKQDEDIVYASVQPSQSNTATWTDGGFPVYSSVNKDKVNKVVGD